MTIQGFASWALTGTFTIMLAVLLALMRYEKAQRGATICAPPRRASLSRASGWGSSAPAKMRSALSRGSVAALGCIVYEVVKAHGSLSTALADAKADLAKAEATVESLVTAAKKVV
jgi:hypothetical protein